MQRVFPPPGVPGDPVRSIDISQDGMVNLVDLSAFAISYLGNGNNLCADYNCNGEVIFDLLDLAIFANLYAIHGPSLATPNGHMGAMPGGVCSN